MIIGGQSILLCPPLDVNAERKIFMADIIAVLILLVLIGCAVGYIVKAKKSGVKCIGCPAGGTCPGSGNMPKKKLDGRVIGRKTMKISGMTCAHCAMNVTQMLNQIDGVRADVNFSSGKAKISYDRKVEDDVLKNAVEKIGYHVISIS